MALIFRSITPADNLPLQELIKTILVELACYESEYLSNKQELLDLYQVYQAPRSQYYVIVDSSTGILYGGGGYAPLEGQENVCEIQKMYLASNLRGQGLGKKLLKQLMKEAQALEFELFYIETMSQMKAAIKLYEHSGFSPIPTRLGSTNHSCCSIFMSKSAL